MDLQACTEHLRARLGDSSGLNDTLKFDCGVDGVVLLDGRAVPKRVGSEDAPADCTLGITLANLAVLPTGELEPSTGFMMGMFKPSGHMAVAMKLQRVV